MIIVVARQIPGSRTSRPQASTGINAACAGETSADPALLILARFAHFRSQLRAGQIMRHAENQALHALDKRIGAFDFFFPVLIGKGDVARHVKIKTVYRTWAAKRIKLAVDDPPRICIASPRDAIDDAVGSVAVVLRLVTRGVFVEQRFVLGGGKAKRHTVDH